MMTREQSTLALLEQVTPMLQNYACSTGFEFADLYQDASITILNILDAGKLQGDDLVRYIAKSVKNLVLMKIRAAKIRKAVSLEAPLTNDQDSGTLADFLPSPYNNDPVAMLLAKERLKDLQVLTSQPMHYRRARLISELQETAIAALEVEEFPISCAWCLVEQGKPLGSGSHGICTRHAGQVRQQSQARRKERRQS